MDVNQASEKQATFQYNGNKSQLFRAMAAAGVSRGDIVRYCKANNITTKDGGEVRYQHVRNVLITPLKKA